VNRIYESKIRTVEALNPDMLDMSPFGLPFPKPFFGNILNLGNSRNFIAMMRWHEAWFVVLLASLFCFQWGAVLGGHDEFCSMSDPESDSCRSIVSSINPSLSFSSEDPPVTFVESPPERSPPKTKRSKLLKKKQKRPLDPKPTQEETKAAEKKPKPRALIVPSGCNHRRDLNEQAIIYALFQTLSDLELVDQIGIVSFCPSDRWADWAPVVQTVKLWTFFQPSKQDHFPEIQSELKDYSHMFIVGREGIDGASLRENAQRRLNVARDFLQDDVYDPNFTTNFKSNFTSNFPTSFHLV